MRTVLKDNSEVAHVWAHQGQTEGRTGSGNCSFDGPKLYSYRACIARLVANARGEPAVLITSRRYSVTTSAHTHEAVSATRHMTRFYVDEPSDTPFICRERKANTIERMTREIPEGRTRDNKAKRYKAAQAYIAECNAFCRFFDLPEFPQLPADDDIEATIQAIRERLDRETAEREEKRRKEAAKRQAEAKKNLRRWLKGEAVGSLYGLPFAYMRLVGDNLETTLGAVVPADHVRRVAPLILKLVRAREAYTPDRDIRFGHYRLDRIEADGTVVVGCHRFEAGEIERVAGLILEPATV